MKILSLISKSKEEKDLNNLKRVGRALARKQEELLDKLEARKDAAQDTIDSLLDGEVKNINLDTFNTDYHNAKLELLVVEKEISIAKEVQKELFTTVKK